MSCDEVCSENHLVCDFVQQEFINNCQSMQKYFGCPYGCWNEVDKYVPAVVEDGRDYDKLCLLSYDAYSFCSAKHEKATRLCNCIPAEKVVTYSIFYSFPRPAKRNVISFTKTKS